MTTIWERAEEIFAKTDELKKQIYTPEELVKETENANYIDNNDEILREYHSKFASTDDPDEFETWLEEIGPEEAVKIIKAKFAVDEDLAKENE